MVKETPISMEMRRVNAFISRVMSKRSPSDYVLIFIPIDPDEKAFTFLNGVAKLDPLLRVESILKSVVDARRTKSYYPFEE